MIRKTLIILGIGTIVTGLAPIAQAQSPQPSRAGNEAVTLSGNSLRAVESRTLADYNRRISNGTSPGSPNNSLINIGRLTQSRRTSPLNDVLNERVDVVFGDTLKAPATINSFPSAGDAGDSERVKLQLQLGQ
jgi:hypothetical protein